VGCPSFGGQLTFSGSRQAARKSVRQARLSGPAVQAQERPGPGRHSTPQLPTRSSSAVLAHRARAEARDRSAALEGWAEPGLPAHRSFGTPRPWPHLPRVACSAACARAPLTANRGLTRHSSRPAPAGGVSPARGPWGIIAVRAYAACLHGRLSSNVRRWLLRAQGWFSKSRCPRTSCVPPSARTRLSCFGTG
jgi:hypothetical protein